MAKEAPKKPTATVYQGSTENTRNIGIRKEKITAENKLVVTDYIEPPKPPKDDSKK
jgi:hypothetical protein